MRSLEEDSSLRRAVDRVPRPVRVVAFLAWAAVVVFNRIQGGETRDVSPWLWAVEALGGAILAAFGLILLGKTFGAPDRRPFEMNNFWMSYFAITGSLMVLGPWSFLDSDPKSDPSIGGPMFVVGVVLAALFVRHLAKPVRAEYPRPNGPWRLFDLGDNEPAPEPTTHDGPEVGRWHLAATRANEGRARRADLASRTGPGVSDDEADSSDIWPSRPSGENDTWR